MREQAHGILNRYLTAELGRSVPLPDGAEISRQRAAFLAHFGPPVLAKMSGPELLRALPFNLENLQPMDYWLEFKNDDEFNYSLFGSISGGSAGKFGVWQERKGGRWRSRQPGSSLIEDTSEDKAIEIVRERQDVMLRAVEAANGFQGKQAADIDPDTFQQTIGAAIGPWASSLWLHKYLHMVCPELVTGNATRPWLEAALYRVGEEPKGQDLYAFDIQIIRFWNSLPALRDLPVELRYRVGKGLAPRDHWCLGLVSDESAWNEMLAHGQLALGPKNVGNLAEAARLNNRRDIRSFVEAAFRNAGLSIQTDDVRNLMVLVDRLKEGSVVALFSDTSTVVAVGEVTGSYRFNHGAERPHQLPVRWHHHHRFETSVSVDLGKKLMELPPTHPAVAEIEASLLVHGVGPWAKFDEQVKNGLSLGNPNEAVASFLDRLANLTAIADLDPNNARHKVRAYRRAAETVRSCHEDIQTLAVQGRLQELPNIGKVIERDIQQFLETGTSDEWRTITGLYPETLLDLLGVSELGEVRVRRIFKELGVSTLPALREAAEDGRITALAGMGAHVTTAVLNYFAARESTPPPLPSLEGVARQVVDMLDRKGQVILYGPPGTGKTYHAERIALEVVARQNFNCLPAQLSDRQRDAVRGRSGAHPYIVSCTFHPMYSYEDFIEGYRPDGDGFKLEPGIFRRMVAAAQAQPEKRFVLIIDEINRGNIPKIFGELITLIEASKRGRMSAHLPLSKEPFTVPENLWIIGTMNTADRSISLLDTALRRRFAFKELLPEPHLLRSGDIAGVTLSTWLRALNRRIVEQLGRDGRNLQVGHAYLMPDGKPPATVSHMGEIFRDELWPLLQEYCYEDPNKLANILAAAQGGVFDPKGANLRFDLFEPGRETELAQALRAIVAPEDTEGGEELDEAGSQESGRDEPSGTDVRKP